jgi:hypothetical protein
MVVELPLRDEGSTVAFGEADMHGHVAGTIPLPMTRLATWEAAYFRDAKAWFAGR